MKYDIAGITFSIRKYCHIYTCCYANILEMEKNQRFCPSMQLIERFRFPRWCEFWTRDITSSCVVWRHAFNLKFRRSKPTWKQSIWGWPLTCGHDVTFRRSRSGKRLSKPPYWYLPSSLKYSRAFILELISPVPHDSKQAVILVSRDLLLRVVPLLMKGR